jgi:hypothetical protein
VSRLDRYKDDTQALVRLYRAAIDTKAGDALSVEQLMKLEAGVAALTPNDWKLVELYYLDPNVARESKAATVKNIAQNSAYTKPVIIDTLKKSNKTINEAANPMPTFVEAFSRLSPKQQHLLVAYFVDKNGDEATRDDELRIDTAIAILNEKTIRGYRHNSSASVNEKEKMKAVIGENMQTLPEDLLETARAYIPPETTSWQDRIQPKPDEKGRG